MSSADNRAAVKRLVGDVRPLPLRVAADVAWKSIKVRLSRSLVTVSSVVLAVAFLLTVVGGDISSRAVHGSYTADNRPIDDVGQLFTCLEGPRKDAVLLGLLADTTNNAELLGWAERLHPGQTAMPAERAERWLSMTEWLHDLKATDRFKAIENTPVVAWLMQLDQPGQLATFISIADTFRGVRLPLTHEELESLASQAPELRRALESLRLAERQRLEQVRAAGGAHQVMQDIRSGKRQADDLDEVGLPLQQIIPEMDAERYQAIQGQLALDHVRVRANETLKRFNNEFSTARSILMIKAFDGSLAQDPRLPVLYEDIKAAVGERALTEIGPAHAKGTRFAAEADIAMLDEMNEVLKEFNQSFAGRKTIPLTALIDGSLDGDRRMPLLESRLNTELSSAEVATLRSELERIIRLRSLREGLNAAGFAEDDDGSRTFWLLILSLMVCIVGIVNSMMMAVTERFREIATMKCLGAMDRFILKAFLIESGSVGLVGAFAGAVLGLIIVLLQSSARYGGTFWSAVPVMDLLLACLAALVCGIILTIFGALLPAYKAARMHPIEAMRLEA